MTRCETCNQQSFVRISWSVRDGIRYSVEPLVDGQIPRGLSRASYELDWFLKVNRAFRIVGIGAKDLKPPADALRDALGLLEDCVSEFLLGDWSRQGEIDALIEEERRFWAEN